jgi:hypothetical protein
MITITLKRFADLSAFFVANRITNHLFYEVRQNESDVGSKRLVNFHFIGVLGTLNVLFQHAENLPVQEKIEDFIVKFMAAIPVEGFTIVEGMIREIFLSLS